eukprot:3577601-Rhodomonas_salina.1
MCEGKKKLSESCFPQQCWLTRGTHWLLLCTKQPSNGKGKQDSAKLFHSSKHHDMRSSSVQRASHCLSMVADTSFRNWGHFTVVTAQTFACQLPKPVDQNEPASLIEAWPGITPLAPLSCRYQLSIKQWSYKEKEFKFSALFPCVEAVCLNCEKAVPPGLTASAAPTSTQSSSPTRIVSGSPPAAPAAPAAAAADTLL